MRSGKAQSLVPRNLARAAINPVSPPALWQSGTNDSNAIHAGNPLQPVKPQTPRRIWQMVMPEHQRAPTRQARKSTLQRGIVARIA